MVHTAGMVTSGFPIESLMGPPFHPVDGHVCDEVTSGRLADGL